MPKAIVIGDTASCGGSVAISPLGPSNVYIQNKLVARENKELVHNAKISGVLGRNAGVYVRNSGIALLGDTVTTHSVGDTTHTEPVITQTSNTSVYIRGN